MKRILVLLLLMALMLPGCAAKPEQPAAMQKDMEQMLQMAQSGNPASAAPELSLAKRLGAPAKYVASFSNVGCNVRVDANADIVLPSVNALPIYRVRPADFSQELVSAVFEVFCGDKEMWYERELEKWSKSELEEWIRINKEQDVSKLSSENQQSWPARMEYLERLYQNAPEVPTKERCFGEFKRINGFTAAGEPLDTLDAVFASTDGEHPCSFGARNNNYEITEGKRYATGELIVPSRNASLFYVDFSLFRNYGQHRESRITELDHPIDGAKGLTVSPHDAIRMAEDFFAKVGIADEYMVESVYLADDQNLGNYDGIVGPAEHYVYRLHCVRKVDGVSCTFMQGSSHIERDSDSPGLWPRWDYENMEIFIDDNGIFDFSWNSPLKVGECINGDVELMPFSEIQSVFEKLIPIKYQGYALDCDVFAFSIDRVTLSLQRISERSSIDDGLLVPVWNFYGLLTQEKNGKIETGGLGGPTVVSSFMSINAIDGTVIIEDQGQ